jgi:MoaA/NifB/PqqE/SkfB family radical SAM enzyme
VFNLNDVGQLHLEVTTRCNASCPMCLRNVRGGGVNPNMPLAELSVADVKKILPIDFIEQLEHVYLGGIYGDASMAQDTLAILEYFRETNRSLRLGMHTNGSPRPPAWWAEVAKLVDYTVFGIDGLEDTNHLYRKGTIWRNVMRNVSAFIGAGGKADWEFIVFRHNEHQIDEACRLSKEMGFSRFKLRYTSRFLFQGQYSDQFPVLDNTGSTEYCLEPPRDPAFLNPAVRTLTGVVRLGAPYENYLNTTKIDCQALGERKLYLSAEGLLFPCSFTAHIYPWNEGFGENQVFRLLMESGGKDAIDAKKRPLQDIVQDVFFARVAESWDKPDSRSGRLRICSEICGECRPVKAQYNKSLI